MLLTLPWHDIAIRLLLAGVFSLLIGLNRDETGHVAGMRTTMLVCLAATLAQIQANLLLDTVGKMATSFAVADVERLPLGILTGVGFIGAGVIMKRDHNTAVGVTTAATLWFVTVLGLLFGGGQLVLGCIGGVVALVILWLLKRLEFLFPRQHTAMLHLTFAANPDEAELRRTIKRAACRIRQWKPTYEHTLGMVALSCELAWAAPSKPEPQMPEALRELNAMPTIRSLQWDE